MVIVSYYSILKVCSGRNSKKYSDFRKFGMFLRM